MVNKDNIPKRSPVIFASNHQNGLMDPLAIIFTTKGQNVFLSRADIFQNQTIARILRQMKILPVYRQQDGSDALKKNEDTFNKTSKILKNNKSLALFPEGTHSDRRSLLPIKKAVSRIAFKAEEAYGFQLGITVVPVGIYYSQISGFRGVIQINYGEPIKVSDYYEKYKHDELKAVNAFNKKLARQIHLLAIDIQNQTYYDLYEFLRDFYNKTMINLLGLNRFNQRNKFTADKKIIEILDNYSENHTSEMKSLNEKVIKYKVGIKSFKLEDWIFEIGKFSFSFLLFEGILMLLFSPLYLLGLICNYPAYKIPLYIITKRVKAIQFYSSFKFLSVFFMFPIYYLLLAILSFIVFDLWWLFIPIFLCLPLIGIFAFNYADKLKRLYKKFRYRTLVRNSKERINLLLNLRKEIKSDMSSIVNEVEPFN